MPNREEIIKTQIPWEYLDGFVDFLGCKIDLSEKTFIPRPETEFWIEKAIRQLKTQNTKIKTKNKKLKTNNRQLTILDAFAGSGCIGIAVLKNCSKFCRRVDFTDVSEKSLKQIKINLGKNRISKRKYRVFKSDIFKNVRGSYDYIFANPPYVAKNRLKEVSKSVLKYEPRQALLAGINGLFYIEKLLITAKKFLKENGIIYLEFDPLQKGKIKRILKKYQYSKFNFYKDQFGKYRWAKITP